MTAVSYDSAEPTPAVRREALLTSLGEQVRAARLARRLSQQALARLAGLSPRFVAQLESGSGNISVVNLAEVARVLDVPLARLLDGAPPSPPGKPPTVIALIGLRGAGKSTLGPLLADALDHRYVELDDEIADVTGLDVSEIFELHGESYYRDAERQVLARLIDSGEPAVCSVSGGAVTDPELFRLLRERALLVWVKAQPEQHMERVASQGDQRPMANRPNAMVELRALLRARAPYYEQAQLVADTSESTPEDCVARLAAQLRRRNANQTTTGLPR